MPATDEISSAVAILNRFAEPKCLSSALTLFSPKPDISPRALAMLEDRL
jgi:hypothetical protein